MKKVPPSRIVAWLNERGSNINLNELKSLDNYRCFAISYLKSHALNKIYQMTLILLR